MVSADGEDFGLGQIRARWVGACRGDADPVHDPSPGCRAAKMGLLEGDANLRRMAVIISANRELCRDKTGKADLPRWLAGYEGLNRPSLDRWCAPNATTWQVVGTGKKLVEKLTPRPVRVAERRKPKSRKRFALKQGGGGSWCLRAARGTSSSTRWSPFKADPALVQPIGMRTVTVVPWSASSVDVATSSEPPCALTMSRITESASPVAWVAPAVRSNMRARPRPGCRGRRPRREHDLVALRVEVAREPAIVPPACGACRAAVAQGVAGERRDGPGDLLGVDPERSGDIRVDRDAERDVAGTRLRIERRRHV